MGRGKHRRTSVLSGFILVLVSCWSLPLQAQQGPPAMVEVAPVVQKTIAQPVTFVGAVEPRRRSQVASEVEGVTSKLYVEEGQSVKQGDTLLDLRQDRLRLALQVGEATAERFRQELAALRNGSRPEEVEEAQAAVHEAEAELEQAQRERSRQRGLSERGVASVQSREDADTAYDLAHKRLLRARKRYELVALGPRAEHVAQAAAQYRAARAEVARIQHDLRHAQVKAPFEGAVVVKHAEVGQWLDQGDPVVTLIELSPARIPVPVPERYIAQVQIGTSALVQFDALPGRTWQGTVVSIIPQATESRTFPVVIEVPNPEAHIKSGMFARVTLTVGEQQNALMVPKDAIVAQGPQQIVYVVQDGKATPVPVQRSTFYEGYAVITGPLNPGDPVVIRGNERLQPGQSVQVAQGRP